MNRPSPLDSLGRLGGRLPSNPTRPGRLPSLARKQPPISQQLSAVAERLDAIDNRVVKAERALEKVTTNDISNEVLA